MPNCAAPPTTGLWRCLAAWGVMLVISVANGAARDLLYGPRMSVLAAHQWSTLSSIVLLGAAIRVFIRRWPPASGRQALRIGLFWMALTITFEFAFFHFVGGHSWSVLLANYDLLAGRIWVLVLLWIAVAPYVFFRLSGRDADQRTSSTI